MTILLMTTEEMNNYTVARLISIFKLDPSWEIVPIIYSNLIYMP